MKSRKKSLKIPKRKSEEEQTTQWLSFSKNLITEDKVVTAT